MTTIPATLNLVIPGRPVPKKNNPVMVKGLNRIFPSKAWRQYEKQALKWLLQWGNVCFDKPVRLNAEYYLENDRWWPDLVGLLQGTQDLLEKAGLISNDRNVICFGRSRIAGLDKQNPRAEITITELTPPAWWRENKKEAHDA